MKQSRDYTLVLLLGIFLLALAFSYPYGNMPWDKHQCSDSQHISCDGECECDGLYCDVPKRDYQLDINQDTATLYDGNRVVGTVLSTGSIDSLMIMDNQ